MTQRSNLLALLIVVSNAASYGSDVSHNEDDRQLGKGIVRRGNFHISHAVEQSVQIGVHRVSRDSLDSLTMIKTCDASQVVDSLSSSIIEDQDAEEIVLQEYLSCRSVYKVIDLRRDVLLQRYLAREIANTGVQTELMKVDIGTQTEPTQQSCCLCDMLCSFFTK